MSCTISAEHVETIYENIYCVYFICTFQDSSSHSSLDHPLWVKAAAVGVVSALVLRLGLYLLKRR